MIIKSGLITTAMGAVKEEDKVSQLFYWTDIIPYTIYVMIIALHSVIIHHFFFDCQRLIIWNVNRNVYVNKYSHLQRPLMSERARLTYRALTWCNVCVAVDRLNVPTIFAIVKVMMACVCAIIKWQITFQLGVSALIVCVCCIRAVRSASSEAHEHT